MTIRRTLTPRRTREVSAPRETSNIRTVLANRRSTVKEAVETRRATARESTDPVVAIPKDETILSDLLDRARSDIRHRRQGDYLHVSDLITKCQRKIAIIERHGLPARAGKLGIMDMLTFRQGEAIHDVIKERAALGSPRMVWGKWRCRCGHLFHDDPCTFDEIDTEDICEHCGDPTIHYEEVSMRDDELMLVGNPDLLLYLEDIDAFHVTELKSIAHEQWQTLARPKPEHVIQVIFYWYIMRKLGYRLTDRVSILYVTKGYIFQGKPYKEFVFEVEPELRRLDDFIEEARMLKEARAGGKLPARTYCPHEDCSDAKQCEVTNICFGENDDTVVEVNIDALFGEGESIHAKRVRRGQIRRDRD